MGSGCAVVVRLYVVACALALMLVPATGAGLFGLDPNPFVALFAVVLGLPWSMISSALAGDLGVGVRLALIAVGMAINVALLRRLCRRAR
jgi:hypothetical protein